MLSATRQCDSKTERLGVVARSACSWPPAWHIDTSSHVTDSFSTRACARKALHPPAQLDAQRVVEATSSLNYPGYRKAQMRFPCSDVFFFFNCETHVASFSEI